MKIYRLEPVAPADDSNWDRANNFGLVFVRAQSPADARIVASEAEGMAIAVETGMERAALNMFPSAFCDEKLYRVDEDGSDRFPTEGPREVLEGVTVNEAMNGPGGAPRDVP